MSHLTLLLAFGGLSIFISVARIEIIVMVAVVAWRRHWAKYETSRRFLLEFIPFGIGFSVFFTSAVAINMELNLGFILGGAGALLAVAIFSRYQIPGSRIQFVCSIAILLGFFAVPLNTIADYHEPEIKRTTLVEMSTRRGCSLKFEPWTEDVPSKEFFGGTTVCRGINKGPVIVRYSRGLFGLAWIMGLKQTPDDKS